MPSPSTTSALRRNLGPTMFALRVLCLLCLLTMQFAYAQTYTVLHNFTGGNDGALPTSGLTLGSAGNLYGTATEGGGSNVCRPGCGTVYQLKHAGSGWVLNSLYVFHGIDGAYPSGGVVFGPGGSLYGSTGGGGTGNCNEGCGTVFKLKPPPTQCHSVVCNWRITTLYSFQGPPFASGGGDLLFDAAGNIYAAGAGGQGLCDDFPGCGVIYQLSPVGGGWSETILHDFSDGTYGRYPNSYLTFDTAGHIYGATLEGGPGAGGTVFMLTPAGNNSPIQNLHSFAFNAEHEPFGGVVLDSAGNVYGSTAAGGAGNGGVFFALTQAGDSWSYNVLYNFINPGMGDFGPWANLTMDAAGNFYGTTVREGVDGCGSVFKLTNANGSWTYTSLHDFTCSDGAYPLSGVVMDSAGNLYGTASAGGSQNKGVVFEITP
jgi:uncharacterized repeat protein (TIGR03803 family)